MPNQPLISLIFGPSSLNNSRVLRGQTVVFLFDRPGVLAAQAFKSIQSPFFSFWSNGLIAVSPRYGWRSRCVPGVSQLMGVCQDPATASPIYRALAHRSSSEGFYQAYQL